MINTVLTLAEQCVRQIYFRSPKLRRLRARPQEARPRWLDLAALRDRLTELGIRHGDALMVHASITRLRVRVAGTGDEVINPIAVAERLVSTLLGAVGHGGTILMPTFPKYADEAEYFSGVYDTSKIPVFDPSRTKSRSGILSEVFRKQPRSLRSDFPLQTVSVQGPDAPWFLRNNIEDGSGLAHGPNSPYGRLAAVNGHVVSIGIPLVDYATIIHAPEDARFNTWPIADFWRPRWFDVVRHAGIERVKVLERDPKYSRGYGEERVRRDLRSAGILSEHSVAGVQVHGLRAGRLFEFFMAKNATTTYPYFWPYISSL